MADLDTEQPLSSLSESSFVILGQGSLPVPSYDASYKEPILSSVTNGKESFSGFESTSTSNKNSHELAGTIFLEEDIQKKLNKLMEENYQLKVTLSQNNLAIKSQLDTFFMWQQEVLKTHESHKQKFLETKELILKLRAENMSLKQQLEDSTMRASSGNNFELYAEVNKKPGEFEKLKEKVKEYEKMYSNLINENENLNMKVLELTEELKSARNEILKLNNELEDLGRDNTYLKQKNDDLNKNSLESVSHKSLPNSEARSQISNLLKQLEEEKFKVLKLKKELKEIKVNNCKASGLKLSATEELNQHIDNLNDINVSLDRQNQRFSSLHSWFFLAEKSLKGDKIHAGVDCDLVCEINELKSHLYQEENISREKQETLNELKKKFTALLDDYKALQLKLSTINKNNTTSEAFKEEISSLLAKLETKDNELKSKEQECSKLKKQVEELNLLHEKVNLLKYQAEIYECDFHDERAAREKLVDEKEHLSEQIRHLQSRVKILEQSTSQKNVSETSPHESQGKDKDHQCKKCNSSFSDFDDYADHIYYCFNIHLD